MTAAAVDQAFGHPPLLFGDASARLALASQGEAYVTRALIMLHRARSLVEADRSGCVALLTARRGALCAHLQRYQRFKHGSVFDPVVRHGHLSSRAIAQAMKIDCLALGEELAAYHTRWTRADAGEWQHYRLDMLSTAESLSIHLKAELRAMHQLIMVSEFYAN